MLCFLAFGVPIGLCPDETISGYADRSATYVLVEMGGVDPSARATLRFPEEGVVTGDGPCNGFRASQGIAYPWIEIGEIAATRRACADLEIEAAYFAMLRAATLVEVAGDVLLLSGEDGLLAAFEAE
ncbi:META domain-containing protein [uncultured Jannaschia sp.]|uniref:META domain-containing protein n=1 Tax=uncultured Jannaschia sp. TaxID=293347 RepID=UPI002627DACE|nr:META domain-containing protein [uncultured Jannaschia sp.]